MAKQTYFGDEIVGVYSPGDIAKNWAPQWFLSRTIQDLAAGFRATKSSLNPLAQVADWGWCFCPKASRPRFRGL